MKLSIITHRGLDPDIPGFPMESSIEAYTEHIDRGYGLEFDVRFTKDNQMIVIHDKSLKRLTKGLYDQTVDTLTLSEILPMDFGGNHLTDLMTLLKVLKEKQRSGQISALHVKSDMQVESKVTAIMQVLIESGIEPEKLIIFDLKPETAEFIKSKWPQFSLSASVSHPYDVGRFNEVVGHTLLTMEEFLSHADIFSWAWLDEWDRRDGTGGDKTLYNKETFNKLRKNGMKIALVTPELHLTTPGQLGGGDHEDGEGERLDSRNREIVMLVPDALCTDHPDRIKALLG